MYEKCSTFRRMEKHLLANESQKAGVIAKHLIIRIRPFSVNNAICLVAGKMESVSRKRLKSAIGPATRQSTGTGLIGAGLQKPAPPVTMGRIRLLATVNNKRLHTVDPGGGHLPAIFFHNSKKFVRKKRLEKYCLSFIQHYKVSEHLKK